MILQSIISQSNTSYFIEPENATWDNATTGNYPTLSGVTKVDLFVPTTSNVDNYNHHPFVIEHNNKLHFIFSTHNVEEEGVGQYVRYMTTDLDLTNASSIQTIFESQDDITKSRSLGGRVCVPSGFAIVNGELYAITDINDRLAGADPRPRVGVGVLARKINTNETFDTVYWIENVDGTTDAPTPISGYPSYTFNNTLRDSIRSYFLNNPENRPDWYYSVPDTDLLYTNKNNFSTGQLVEPRITPLPNGGYVKLWRPNGTTNDNIKYAQFSEFGNIWSDVIATEIPDFPSRTSVNLTNNNIVVIIGNNDMGIRSPLFIAVSADGTSVNSGDVYNLDTETNAPTFSGHGKGIGVQYPYSIKLNSNKIVCVYSVNKESIRASIFDAPELN